MIGFPNSTRTWIYQSNKKLSQTESEEIQNSLTDFISSWTSHNRQLNAFGKIIDSLFIIIAVDEKNADASGCSIDKSVKFLQDIEHQYGIELFNRMVFAYEENGKAISVDSAAFQALYAKVTLMMKQLFTTT